MEKWWLSLHGLEVITAGTPAGEGDLTLRIGEDEYALGAAGADSVTLSDSNGITIYADLDGDGEVDHISSIHGDGGFDVYSADPHRAAWGLAGGDDHTGADGRTASWGLPADSTPGKGAPRSGVDQQTGTWLRIEQG